MKKKMKKVMFLFAIVALTILAQSCEPGPNLEAKSYVSGVVTDAATGNPIVRCAVYLSRHTPAKHISAREAEPVAPEMVLTDSVGFYEFSRLYMGTYNLSAIADGYLPSDNQEVTLMEHEVEVNFQLVKGE